MTKKIISLFFVSALLCSCVGGKSSDKDKGNALALKYAQLLTIAEHDGVMNATISDPWQEGKKLQKLSVGHADEAHTLAPFERVIVLSTSHCYLMECLGVADKIVGVCEPKYILLPNIQQRIKDGHIKDCGEAMSPDIERIISLNPDAIIVSPFEGSGGFGKLEKLGIPIVQAADYMEKSALGRAEWMRYYGRLFGVGERADSLFRVVDSTYQSLCQYASKLKVGRSVLTERKTGATWYTPGGKSNIATVIKDANGRYAFSDDNNGGSLALSPEQIIDKAGDTEVWAFKYHGGKGMLTRDDLLREYRGYAALKAFQTGTIYECNTAEVPYFEEVAFRPDFLLKEMIQLLHPEVSLGPLRYYRFISEK